MRCDPLLDPVQFVTPRGELVAAHAERAAALRDRLPSFYEDMVVTREVDEEMINLQRQGQLALYPSCRGQEAAQIGCVSALRSDDWLFPQYRELAVFLARGIEPSGIGLAWRGACHGGDGFVERCVAPLCIPIGTHALHAVGAAMASTRLGDDGVTVAFLGDGATSEGDVHEALNLAAVESAPCIFFVQNNGWAISVPVGSQLRAASIAHKGVGYGIVAVRVDGNDVLACHSVVAEAAERARCGAGPTLIEAVTYRMGPHTTSDDPTRYRSDDEVAEWRTKDPITRLRAFMEHEGEWDDAIAATASARAAELRTALRDSIVDAPEPRPDSLFTHVYSRSTWDLEDQLAQLADEIAQIP